MTTVVMSFLFGKGEGNRTHLHGTVRWTMRTNISGIVSRFFLPGIVLAAIQIAPRANPKHSTLCPYTGLGDS